MKTSKTTQNTSSSTQQKSDSENISKLILSKLNTRVKENLNVNKWKNTQNVIEWFGNIDEKLAILSFSLNQALSLI